jgi:WD40 repeat protein
MTRQKSKVKAKALGKKKPAKTPGRKPKKAPAKRKASKPPARKLLHPYLHRTELVAMGLSPDGRYLATGSFVGENYEAGGDLLIWDLSTARVVNHFAIEGGVGWPDYANCIQWSPDGKRLAIAFNTNGVAFLDPFALTGQRVLEELYVTDGWSRPPSFAWAFDSKRAFISCWRPSYNQRTRKPNPPVEGPDVPGCIAGIGTKLTYLEPGIPEGAWRGSDNGEGGRQIEAPNSIQFGKQRLLGANGHSQVFCVDPRTRKLAWLRSARSVAFHPSAEWLAIENGRVQLWNGDGVDQPWATFDVAFPLAMHWSLDGERLAVIEGEDADTPNRISIFDVNFGASVTLAGRIETGPRTRGSWPGDFDTFAWGPKSDSVAFIDEDGRVNVWNVAAAPAAIASFEAGEPKGLRWAPSERLLAWSGRSLTFIDVAPAPKLTTRALLDLPGDDGPFGNERLAQFASAQFPLGKPGARVWGAVLEELIIVPAGHEAEADEVLGWADGRTSAPLATVPVRRFRSIADAIRSAPKSIPAAVRDVHGGGAKPVASWGISDEPRELFDLWALIELEAAEAGNDPYVANWYALLLARLYHRAGMDDAALKALDRAPSWPDGLRVRLELALSHAVRGKFDLARRYAAPVDDALVAKVYERSSDLRPQCDALRGALLELEGKGGLELIERAEQALEPENNRGEKRLSVALALLATGEVERALAHAPKLQANQRVVLLREAGPRGLPDFRKFARACATGDFNVLYATVDGFLSLGAIDDAFESLSWFTGLSTRQERTLIFEAGLRRNGPEFVTGRYGKASSPEERLECVRLMAGLDAEVARGWLAKERGVSLERCIAAAALGEAGPAREALEEGNLEFAVAALEADARLWPLLGAEAFELARAAKNALELAGLANAARRAADAVAAGHAAAEAVRGVDLSRHWGVGEVAARFARAGDDANAFAVLQRMPKSKRSYAIPAVSVALGDRLAEKQDARSFAAAYGLLATLPTDSRGSGGRAFETSRVLRRIFKWSRGEQDGLVD